MLLMFIVMTHISAIYVNRCCDVGIAFCGPQCKPEPSCRDTSSSGATQTGTDNALLEQAMDEEHPKEKEIVNTPVIDNGEHNCSLKFEDVFSENAHTSFDSDEVSEAFDFSDYQQDDPKFSSFDVNAINDTLQTIGHALPDKSNHTAFNNDTLFTSMLTHRETLDIINQILSSDYGDSVEGSGEKEH